jgi:NAD(P)H dehydrogenase (quinone)
MKIVLDERWM